VSAIWKNRKDKTNLERLCLHAGNKDFLFLLKSYSVTSILSSITKYTSQKKCWHKVYRNAVSQWIADLASYWGKSSEIENEKEAEIHPVKWALAPWMPWGHILITVTLIVGGKWGKALGMCKQVT
jgi:hypothetical protein